MVRIKRQRRVECKLPCAVVESSRRRVQGRVVTLSEGGLSVITELNFDQGDPIRLKISSGKGGRSISVSAIVWNEIKPKRGRALGSRLRRYGCVVSEPSRSFLELIDRFDTKPRRVDRVPIAVPKRRDVEAECCEADLPRSREIQPPPKPEPEETLPYFRVRMKQIGGPRTRILTVRSRSASQAEQLALDELSKVCKDAEGWGILHISKVAGNR